MIDGPVFFLGLGVGIVATLAFGGLVVIGIGGWLQRRAEDPRRR